ncbi:zinc dependent phospholipase C family protein [Anoxybacterium hadale]|uniref:zinc dependent phospholipase C family protein n=1 Tax=Anoxybacterium hadale TaxID=3408580 RepID=UPI003B00FF9F
MAEIIYEQVKNQLPLDKNAFVFGNIKPDLTRKLLRSAHIMDHYLIHVSNQTKVLMRGELPPKELSYELGKLCHYVCDFFCKYHLNYDLFTLYGNHFFYEWKLDFHLRTADYRKWKPLYTIEESRSVADFIFDMRRAYLSEKNTDDKDVRYAVSASIWLCQSVFHFLLEDSRELENQHLQANSVLPMAGGQ